MRHPTEIKADTYPNPLHYSNLNMKLKLQTIRYGKAFTVNTSNEQISKNHSNYKQQLKVQK
jgi:hypothetical protein